MNSRIRARLSPKHLRSNTERILSWVPDSMQLVPMLKADGYGHGAVETARTLFASPHLAKRIHALGVATLEEGIELRRAFPQSAIWIFSETVPLTGDRIAVLLAHRLSPVIHTLRDLPTWCHATRHRPDAQYSLFLNTGMNRLGIRTDQAIAELPKFIHSVPSSQHPHCILSHLASGEAEHSSLTRLQIQSFKKAQTALRALVPMAHWSLQNSGGLWHHSVYKKAGLELTIGRPGLSLYGYACRPELQKRSRLIPVMDLEVPVAAIHELKRGAQVGYGGRYRVTKATESIAILQAGYADGIHRSLYKKGLVAWGTKQLPFRGVVSMDLCAVGAPKGIGLGDWVTVFGKDFPAWQNALAIQSIPYELLTHVSPRVPRLWEDT